MTNEWQPIATAPQDGTNVIVGYDFATVWIVHNAWYRNKEEWENSGKYCGGFDSLREWEGWWSYIEHSVTQHKLEGHHLPSHWIPLPNLPKPS